MAELKYQRVLLKLSGEALAGEGGFGINPSQAEFLAHRVLDVVNMGIQIAVVIGAGNIWRGKQDGLDHGMERVTADHMGMLATVMNSLAVQDALERLGVPTRVLTGIEVRAVANRQLWRSVRCWLLGSWLVSCWLLWAHGRRPLGDRGGLWRQEQPGGPPGGPLAGEQLRVR